MKYIDEIFKYVIRNKIPVLGGICWRTRKMFLPNKIVTLDLIEPDISISINPQSQMGTYIYVYGVWEKEITKFIQEIGPFNTVLDIGGHIGYHSLLFEKNLIDTGKLFVFEPDDEARMLLEENLKVSTKTVKIEPFAVSNLTQLLYFKDNTIVLNDSETKTKVECITIDEYVENNLIESIDLIKMDIEGYEFHALLGMKKTLDRIKPQMIIEVHVQQLNSFGYSDKELKVFLGDHSYQIKTLKIDSEYNYTIYCFNPN